LDTSRLSESEFIKLMGVSRREFEKYPAYKKVEIKQAKNVV